VLLACEHANGLPLRPCRSTALTGRRPGRNRAAGFTLIELLVVVALIAITSATISLALRDPTEMQLEREAQRLAALLEAARAESRASGLTVHWYPKSQKAGDDFRFDGLPRTIQLPTRWLGDPVAVQIENATAVNPGLVLGPEPIIPAQRLRLRLGDKLLVLGTDGLAAFDVVTPQ
jgi:general secretion pathway protein H